MSIITLDVAKTFLDVIHTGDDVKLQILLDGAEDESVQYMNRADLTEWDSDVVVSSEYLMPMGVVVAVMLLLQASYQALPDEIDKLRKAAETKLTPYRQGWGI